MFIVTVTLIAVALAMASAVYDPEHTKAGAETCEDDDFGADVYLE